MKRLFNMSFVNKDERVLLYKKGDYFKMLGPGWHFISPFLYAEAHNMAPVFAPSLNFALYPDDAELMSELQVVEVGDSNICLLFEDGNFKQVLKAGKYVYWKDLVKREL